MPFVAPRFWLAAPVAVLMVLGALSFLAWNRTHRTFADVPAERFGSSAGARSVDWARLRENRPPAGLVRIPGFVVPLEESGRAVEEFLLVPSRPCLHTAPPPANQTVLVKGLPGDAVGGAAGSAIWVYGKFRPKAAPSSGVAGTGAGFEIDSEKIEPFDP